VPALYNLKYVNPGFQDLPKEKKDTARNTTAIKLMGFEVPKKLVSMKVFSIFALL